MTYEPDDREAPGISEEEGGDLRQRTKAFALRVVKMYCALQSGSRRRFWGSKYCVRALRSEQISGKPHGISGFIAMQSWMFGDRYKKFRAKFIKDNNIVTLAQFGAHAFDTISGEIVQTAAVSFQKRPAEDRLTVFDV